MSSLEAAVLTSQCDTVKLLAQYKTDINGYIPPFGTALQAAARRGDMDLLKTPLDCGADVKTTTSGSIYASALEAGLLTTNRSYQREIMDMLLARGTNPNSSQAGASNKLLVEKAVELGGNVAVKADLCAVFVYC